MGAAVAPLVVSFPCTLLPAAAPGTLLGAAAAYYSCCVVCSPKILTSSCAADAAATQALQQAGVASVLVSLRVLPPFHLQVLFVMRLV
jgi:hypothetical protein